MLFFYPNLIIITVQIPISIVVQKGNRPLLTASKHIRGTILSTPYRFVTVEGQAFIPINLSNQYIVDTEAAFGINLYLK